MSVAVFLLWYSLLLCFLPLFLAQGSVTFSVGEYNMLADAYGHNYDPWFLFQPEGLCNATDPLAPELVAEACESRLLEAECDLSSCAWTPLPAVNMTGETREYMEALFFTKVQCSLTANYEGHACFACTNRDGVCKGPEVQGVAVLDGLQFTQCVRGAAKLPCGEDEGRMYLFNGKKWEHVYASAMVGKETARRAYVEGMKRVDRADFWWANRFPKLVAMIKALAADATLVVEMDHLDGFKTDLPGEGFEVAQRTDGKTFKPDYNGVLFKKTVFEPSKTRAEPLVVVFGDGSAKVGVISVLKLKGTDQTVMFVSTHLQKSSSSERNERVRVAELVKLKEGVKSVLAEDGEMPIFFGGDFNSQKGLHATGPLGVDCYQFMATEFGKGLLPGGGDVAFATPFEAFIAAHKCTSVTVARREWIDYIWVGSRDAGLVATHVSVASPNGTILDIALRGAVEQFPDCEAFVTRDALGNELMGLPNQVTPSDHIPVAIHFRLEVSAADATTDIRDSRVAGSEEVLINESRVAGSEGWANVMLLSIATAIMSRAL